MLLCINHRQRDRQDFRAYTIPPQFYEHRDRDAVAQHGLPPFPTRHLCSRILPPAPWVHVIPPTRPPNHLDAFLLCGATAYTHKKAKVLIAALQLIEDLAFVGERALPLSNRMHIADARRIIQRKGDHNRRDVERRDTGDSSIIARLAADRHVARYNRHVQVAAASDCRYCANPVCLAAVSSPGRSSRRKTNMCAHSPTPKRL